MSNFFTLFVGDESWRAGAARGVATQVEPISWEKDTTLDERAAAAGKQLANMGWTGGPIVLALPSSWCLCATISIESLDRGGRRRAMGFRLEEHLPISAEDVVADYVEAQAGQAMGVCGELTKLTAIVTALEPAGLEVAHICPAALLAAAHAVGGAVEMCAVLRGRGSGAASTQDTTAESRSRSSLAEAGFDLIEFHKGKPTQWWWLADDVAAVRERLAALKAAQAAPVKLATFGGAEATLPMDRELQGIECVPIGEVSDEQAAALAAAKILQGVASAWIDLRRDALAAADPYQAYRKPLGALIAATVLLLIGVVIVSQWRGRQYAAAARQTADRQIEAFKDAMPNQRPPASIKGRLLSERQKLAGLGGAAAGGGDAGTATPTSALEQLRAVLAGLPVDVRFRILDLAIQPDLIRIDGQARSHADAERVAVALRQAGLRDVEPPKTQAINDGGVSFFFTAKPAGPAAGPSSNPAAVPPAARQGEPAAMKGGE